MTDKWKANGRAGRDKVGMPYRHQKNVYSMRVTLILTGGKYACPCCGVEFDLSNPQSYDVDKVIPALDYIPTNVVTICRRCNGSRGELQSIGKDWTYVTKDFPDGRPGYARRVREASAKVTIPKLGAETETEWKALTAHRPKGSGSMFA